MATAADVEDSLRSLARMIEEASPSSGSLPERSIVCIVPDLRAAFRAELRDGRLRNIAPAAPADASDVRITARSDDLIALIERRLSLPFAFLTGKVRVEASAADLMMIRRLF